MSQVDMKSMILGVILYLAATVQGLPEEVNPAFIKTLKRFRAGPLPHISFHRYNTQEEIVEYVEYLSRVHPHLASSETIGYTAEGRPIQALRVSSDPSAMKPAILIDAGIHAREWVAPAVALYLMYQLVENYRNNKALVDKLDWYVIPLLNPDGYAYSMTEDRFWRKNRANTTDPRCKGVDLNRNFDVYFGGLGTSDYPCDETYVGTGPFSEPESRALRDYALRHKNRIQLYITLHSYGQYFLYPWGFGDVLPKDWQDLDKLARVAEKALSSVYGTRYQVGSSTRILGPAAGGSDDWMKARAGVKYSYTIELPGGGDDGFDLPESKIIFAATEMFEAIKLSALFVFDQSRRTTVS
uniref:Venom M14 protease n=1 Tax=Lethocerus distinctifemur TaxID=280095 RepID=A0A2K8JL55_9HEMI|nr:venom M14 protease [Lethocerus distinctifemur]